MAIDELPQFMQAIGTLESGNRYDAIGPYTGSSYGRARGRYQIMETIWPGWAAEAGIPGADWRDPQAQDHVARFKMGQYYRRYGRWDLVAVAWFAGPGRANEAQKRGISSVGGLKDVIGTSVASYIEKAMGLMGKSSAPLSSEQRDPLHVRYADSITGGLSSDPQEQAAQEFVEQRRLATDNMGSIMEFISQAASKQGGKVLDTRALFGDIFTDDEEPEEEEVG